MINNQNDLLKEIETLKKALAEAVKERDYWKNECEEVKAYYEDYLDHVLIYW
jgi:predicted nuclease with TOPRIM domain